MQNVRAEVVRAFAPQGRVRAVINTGNAILARAGEQGADPTGISVDLAREWARHLGVPLELQVVAQARSSVEAVAADEADIGFFAIDPARGERIAFTAAYVLIEGWYAVRTDSPIQRNQDVDRDGQSVMVARGSAYDLFLSRELKAATILRAPTTPSVVERFLAENADVAAGIRQQLDADLARVGGMRLLPERFMVIEQAMGVPKSRGAAAAQALSAFVEDMKASGFVAEAMKRHGIEGALVAPPAVGDEHPRG